MRAKGNRNCAVLLFLLGWVFLLHCLSIFLFTKGFLLRRTVVFNSSRCSDEWVAIDVTDARITNSASNRTRCWMERRYNKLVIIVIDALRVDFGLFDPLLSISDTPHYRNKLPIIHELLVSPPEKNDAHIFRFIADPPTTTMQRIKGLTTGSLPTFIDAGDNFASNALAEDNWVTSARDNGFGLVMLGDDTWLSLYPHHFTREFGYNPFDVKDLHTVDNGILKNLFSELKKPDWSILVAHFEGVDHVGHRFGPNHPEMAAKLSQMDNVIRNVVDTLDNSTLLVVMGDHGMTPSGDHGGESVQETNALLFMYSKQQRLYPESMGLRSVSQTDLVPTVSLLLGLPIPFSNLGHVIPELFFYGKNPNHTLLRAMHLNACQLSQYLDTYNKVSGDLPSQEFYQLDIEFHLIKKDFWLFMSNTGSVDFEQLQTLYLKYFQQVQAMCRSVWAKFDLVLMWLGIFMLVISLLPVLVLVFQVRSNSTIQLQYYNRIWIYIMCGAVFGSIFGIPLHYLASSKSSDSLLMFCCFGSSLGSVIAYLWFECRSVLMKFAASSDRKLLRDQFPDIDDLFATVIVFIQCFGLLSNSYVLYEDSCISFFLVSLYVVCLVAKASQLAKFQSVGSNANIGRKSLYFHSASVFSLAIVIAAICSQTATHFQGCVELKIGCKPSSFLLSLSAAEHLIGSMKTARYAISCICVALVPATVWFLLKRQGQLENFSPFHLSASCGLPAIVVCIWIYWALMALPAESLDQLPDWQHVIMPRIVYVIAIVIVVVVLLRPVAAKARICGFLPHLRPQSKSTVMELSGWESLYVSPALLLWVTVWLILTLLQGDGLAPAMLLFALQVMFTIVFVVIFASLGRQKEKGVRWCEIVLWMTLSYHFFYSTGHQPIFSDIHFNAAFVGFRGIAVGFLSLSLSALLVMLNTFTSQTLCVFGLPLLLFVKSGKLLSEKFADKEKGKSCQKSLSGPPRITVNSEHLQIAFFRLILQYMLCHTFKLIGAAIMATFLRRHLMVWAVFAPRYLFEVLNFVYGEILCIFVFMFVVLLDSRIRSWLYDISQTCSFFYY